MKDGEITLEYIQENYECWGYLNANPDGIMAKKKQQPNVWSEFIIGKNLRIVINPISKVYYKVDSSG